MCRHTPTVATTQWDPKSLSPAVVRVVWHTMALSVTFLHPLVPTLNDPSPDATDGDSEQQTHQSQIDPYGTWFRLSTPKTSAVIPNGQTGSTFLT